MWCTARGIKEWQGERALKYNCPTTTTMVTGVRLGDDRELGASSSLVVPRRGGHLLLACLAGRGTSPVTGTLQSALELISTRRAAAHRGEVSKATDTHGRPFSLRPRGPARQPARPPALRLRKENGSSASPRGPLRSPTRYLAGP